MKTDDEVQRIVHDLQVHQAELEVQNEELRRAQVSLDTARARYFDLYDLAPMGYCTISDRGLILEANLTAAAMLGVPRASLSGQAFTRFILPQDQDLYLRHRRLLLDGLPGPLCELRILGPGTAGFFWGNLSVRATQDPEGQLVFLVAITDISARRLAEEDRAVLQTQLAHAQKLEAIGTLAGGIAHDFNNILGAILGGLSALDHDLGEASPHHNEILEMMAMVERGSNLSRQLLGFSCRGKYDVKPLNLGRVVQKTAALFGRSRLDIEVKTSLSQDLRAVLMDHAQLEEVLLNLLINAGQAMPQGGRLTLEAQNVELGPQELQPHEAPPGRFVRLVVSDTGTGMNEATLARIFEPFFTTRGVGQGTGLGLPSVYGIVKHHGGFVRVESALNKGSSFALFLPTTDLPWAEEKPTPAQFHCGQGTILVVDDEPQVLKVCSLMLKRLGYKVLTAPGGKQALELLRQDGEKISLVILDLTMPELNGVQTFHALRELCPGLKVLLASGYSLEGQAQELLDSGCNGFIQKPFGLEALSAGLARII
jgi:PAS domain S-box-containing protein